MEEKGDHVSSLEEEGELGAIGRRFRVPPPFLTFLLRNKKKRRGRGRLGKKMAGLEVNEVRGGSEIRKARGREAKKKKVGESGER